MASFSNSEITSFLSTMKKQNDDILADEEDNRKLRQEPLNTKISQTLNHSNSLSSRKRDEAEHKNERSNTNKKLRVASLPDPGRVNEPPASFDTLDDDCLGNVLGFVGKSCYSAFGLVNKRCHEMFCSKGYPKKTFKYGYGPLHLIQQQPIDKGYYDGGYSKGVLHYNRRDIIEWMLTDESYFGDYEGLKYLCSEAIKESRLDVLREVFRRANAQKLKYLRDHNEGYDLCYYAARRGKLEILKWLSQNECGWDKLAWYYAKQNGHEHILEYSRNNGYPTEWQD